MAKLKVKNLPAWVQAPLYLAVRGAIAAMGTVEFARAAPAARAMGRLYASAPFNRARLRRATENLSLVYPDWTPERRLEQAILAYEHLFLLGVEMAYTPRLLSEDGWSRVVRVDRLGEGLRVLLDCLRTCRPSVQISGHCGNWELLGYSMAVLGFPMHALYRPLDLRPLDRWVQRTRQSRGLVLVDKFGAVEELPRVLDLGHAIGFVADQNGGDRGLFVPFFGRLASSYKSIGLLARRFEAPIVCGMARRLAPADLGPDDSLFAYTIDLADVIHPADWASQPDPVFYITARYRRAIEAMVRSAPEQYLWMHRYWKSRPRHERLGRPFPGALLDKLRTLPWMTEDELVRIVEQSDRDARALARH
jgi:KDO2-lipid IV(A) lauroyltransferase